MSWHESNRETFVMSLKALIEWRIARKSPFDPGSGSNGRGNRRLLAIEQIRSAVRRQSHVPHCELGIWFEYSLCLGLSNLVGIVNIGDA
jgi:hypothetical protein